MTTLYFVVASDTENYDLMIESSGSIQEVIRQWRKYYTEDPDESPCEHAEKSMRIFEVVTPITGKNRALPWHSSDGLLLVHGPKNKG